MTEKRILIDVIKDSNSTRINPANTCYEHAASLWYVSSDSIKINSIEQLANKSTGPSTLSQDIMDGRGMTSDRPRGVKVSHLLQFIEDNGGRGAFEGLTTSEVCERILKPLTRASGLSYCELKQLEQGPSNNAVGDARWFISHAWGYLFQEVLCQQNFFYFFNQLQYPVQMIKDSIFIYSGCRLHRVVHTEQVRRRRRRR